MGEDQKVLERIPEDLRIIIWNCKSEKLGEIIDNINRELVDRGLDPFSPQEILDAMQGNFVCQEAITKAVNEINKERGVS